MYADRGIHAVEPGLRYQSPAEVDLVSAQTRASTSLDLVLSKALKEDDAKYNRVGKDGLEGREADLKRDLKRLDDVVESMKKGTPEEKKAAARAEVDEYLYTYTPSSATRAEFSAALAKAREGREGGRRRRKSKTRARKTRGAMKKTRSTRRR